MKRLALLFVLLAVPAHAGRAGSIGLWCGAKTGDLLTTELALRNGAHESNPLMKNQATRIGVGVGTCVVAGEVDHRLRKHTKTRWIYRALGVGLMGYAIQRNAQNAGGAK